MNESIKKKINYTNLAPGNIFADNDEKGNIRFFIEDLGLEQSLDCFESPEAIELRK